MTELQRARLCEAVRIAALGVQRYRKEIAAAGRAEPGPASESVSRGPETEAPVSARVVRVRGGRKVQGLEGQR